MSGLRRLIEGLAWFGFLVVLILGALTARVISEGEAELSASNAAFDRGELRPALEHAHRSATLYAPGAPHVDQAYQRLIAIALGSEAAGQPKIAFLSWQAVRSAALESRHVWIARSNELDRANQNLSRLEALARPAHDDEPGKAQIQALSRLSEDSAPSPGWIAVLGAGFLLALLGLGLFAFRGLDPRGTVAVRRGRVGLLLFAIGAACWTLAAYKA